jgi:hypothetical protein
MSAVWSLDQQYLDFNVRTRSIFAHYPQMEPLRYFIFKHLLVQPRPMSWVDAAKYWLRPLRLVTRSRGPLNQSDVLIWIETQREVIVDALLPVYQELVSRGIEVQLVSYRGPDDLPPSVVPFQFPARVLPPAWSKGAWEALCDVIEELRPRSRRRWFQYACANIQGLLEELHRILARIRPRIVVCASTNYAGGAGLMVASRVHGALTHLLQHGITQAFYTPLLADYMLTWGASTNETLEQLGLPRPRLIPLGSPRHDSMRPSLDGRGRAELRRSLSLPDRPTFVFFSNGNDLVRNRNAPRECAAWLEKTAAEFSNTVNIIVRLHPNEDGSLYRNCPHVCRTKGSPSLAVTLDGCDWVGSLCSTVLYDALLFNKPVWQFYADEWPELADNWKYGLAARISSQAELSMMVDHILREGTGRSVDENLSAWVFSNHGRAAQAVADFIQRCLEEKGTHSLKTIAVRQADPLEQEVNTSRPPEYHRARQQLKSRFGEDDGYPRIWEPTDQKSQS